MGTTVLSPGEWPDIVRRIQEDDPTVGSTISDRERRFDNFFGTISDTETTPGRVRQAGSERATSSHGLWGYRVGNWVTLRGTAVIGAVSATGGAITVDFPAALPFDTSADNQSLSSIGIMSVYINSSTAQYVGEIQGSVLGRFSGTANGRILSMGSQDPAAALVQYDTVRYNITYRTNNLLV